MLTDYQDTETESGKLQIPGQIWLEGKEAVEGLVRERAETSVYEPEPF